MCVLPKMCSLAVEEMVSSVQPATLGTAPAPSRLHTACLCRGLCAASSAACGGPSVGCLHALGDSSYGLDRWLCDPVLLQVASLPALLKAAGGDQLAESFLHQPNLLPLGHLVYLCLLPAACCSLAARRCALRPRPEPSNTALC